MELAHLEPIELGGLIAAGVIIAGLIYWRMRQGRMDKEAQDADQPKP
ncbi:MAG TPA: hypothetical protein VGP63_10200 [Planctomycetaceae bacterium]|jgi:hypothetical protein|nr:hypothetical protein [Planctomycetaceae bacterium]